MRGGHAHEESALMATVLMIVVGIVDIFINIGDEHPIKIVVYIILWFVLYALIRYFRQKAWSPRK